MPESILGINISSDSVTAVQATSRLKGYEVTACGHAVIHEEGGLDQGLKALAEQMGLDADVCVCALPGERVSYRNLRLPFKGAKKIRQTLAYELETIVPFPVEDLIIDFTTLEQGGQSEILAASLNRTWISEHLSQMQANGIDPAVLDISGVPTVCWLLTREETPDEGLLLDMGSNINTLIYFAARRIALIRTFPLHGPGSAGAVSDSETSNENPAEAGRETGSSLNAFCVDVQTTLHAFSSRGLQVNPGRIFLTGRGAALPGVETTIRRFFDIPVKRLNLSDDPRIQMAENTAERWDPALMDPALALVMRNGKHNLGFNFRRDEFEVRKRYFGHKKEIGKVAAFLMVILLLVGLDLGVEYYSLKKHYEQIDRQVVGVFKETFPGVTRIVDPVHQMQVKINEIRQAAAALPGVGAEGTVLDLLKDISFRVPDGADVHMTRIVIDPDMVLVKGETDTFNTVDAIKKGLEPSSFFKDVTISSANLERDGDRVTFEMKLQRAKLQPAGT